MINELIIVTLFLLLYYIKDPLHSRMSYVDDTDSAEGRRCVYSFLGIWNVLYTKLKSLIEKLIVEHELNMTTTSWFYVCM